MTNPPPGQKLWRRGWHDLGIKKMTWSCILTWGLLRGMGWLSLDCLDKNYKEPTSPNKKKGAKNLTFPSEKTTLLGRKRDQQRLGSGHVGHNGRWRTWRLRFGVLTNGRHGADTETFGEIFTNRKQEKCCLSFARFLPIDDSKYGKCTKSSLRCAHYTT